MTGISEHVQSADWKKEKHAPVIECPDTVTAGEMFEVRLSIGKEIGHPNTTEHHISWIRVYFHPEGKKFTNEIGLFEFNAHGESTEGPNTGPVYTHPDVSVRMKTNEPGVLYAVSFCNIHGLWESSKDIGVA
jgi:superoxide reductase